MLADLLVMLPHPPDVWGEGALFAFSGLDGPTCVASGFVATFGAQPYDLLFHTPTRRLLRLALEDLGTVRLATGDVLAVETPQGPLLLTYSAWHTLVGLLPQGAGVNLAFEGEPGEPSKLASFSWVVKDEDAGDVLVCLREGERLALAYARSEKTAWRRARAGLERNPWQEAAQRLAFYRRVPVLPDASRQRLLNKCISVMRVNTLAPEGAIRHTWTTPDRVPHKDMWLWDTVFHSLALNRLDPRVAWDSLRAMLETQQPDGMIPHQFSITGWHSHITQPPILAWGVWENYQVTQDRANLEWALPRLEAYLAWDCARRDQNGNGLLEWFIEEHPLCRSGESGMDNSPRFDAAIPLDAVDFSTFAALDMGYTALIAATLGQADKALAWAVRSRRLSEAIHRQLWDKEDGFYYDRDLQGRFSRVRAVSGFLPLLLDDLPPKRVTRLVAWLKDPAEFGTAFPVPSVAASHPAYSTDMWRGATWLNFNYLIILGLRRQGREEEARWLQEKTIHYVNKYYERYGVIFEFFDSQDQRPPTLCDRKGPHQEPYNIRRKMDSIRDYHFTAALVACLLWE
jgi:glycogen debranching enzyme